MAPLTVLAMLLAALWPATAVTAQETFRDADFDFSFEVPEGLELIGEADARRVFALPDDQPYNAARQGTPGERLSHQFHWRDSSGHGRSARLLIQDLPLPFTRPDEFADYLRTTAGEGETVEIVEQKSLEPPTHKAGLMAEVTRSREGGGAVNLIYAYYPMGRERFALLFLQGLPADWKKLRKTYGATLATVAFVGEQGGAAGGSGAPGQGRAPSGPNTAADRRGKPAAGGAAAPEEYWSSLEVTGSLVLAVVLLAGLFVGGRRS